MDRRTEDLRVLRTHTLLLRALSDLLQEKPFDEIRVKDLCQRAMVHRSTFYAHFEDKRHLQGDARLPQVRQAHPRCQQDRGRQEGPRLQALRR